jgi:hypothetical protein
VPLLIAAGILAVLLALAHSVLGERYILRRLFRREDLPKLFGGVEFTKQTLRFAWHITSVAWCGLGGVLFFLDGGPWAGGGVAKVVATTFGVSGAVALVGSRGRHPSWIVFFLIAVLSWWGAR